MNKKVAVVTGSGRGIGHTSAKALEKDGFLVVYSDIQDTSPEEHYIKCDISKKEDRDNLARQTVERFGRVDVLMNNAGVAPAVRADILSATEESFQRVLKINLEGTFFTTQAFANQMVALTGKITDYAPKIINVASVSAYASSVERGEYCISKAGIAMVTQLFAHRLAEYGIGVFEIRPGIIMTDMTAAVTEKYEKLIEEGITPIKRFGYPEDIAKTVSAICGGSFDFSPGQVFNVDGGFHLRRF